MTSDDDDELLARHRVVLVRADNPGPMTLTGTNTWIVGRDPAWVIDPGPDLEAHVGAVSAEVERRGGLGGIVLTHHHGDHSGAVPALRERHPAPLAAASDEADVRLDEGTRFGPFEALATPGHAPDHFALLAGGACFTGDAVLGSGSVFISPHPGALDGYLRALRGLSMREEIELLCPGHGPLVRDPKVKIEEYLAHRLERERRLREALSDGKRTVDELLDHAWSEVPGHLRPAAAVTLAAHLDKLDGEGALPAGVERPEFPGVEW